MKKICLLLSFLWLCHTGQAQTAASYNFTALSGTFASISATGTYVGGVIGDDITQTSIPIGFTFNFCGAGYTQLSACSNGWLSFVNAATTGFTSRSNTAANAGAIGAGLLMAYWDDLDGGAFFTPTGNAYYQTTGSSPNRIFTFEWNNFRLFLGSTSATFQVKLYESSNIVEYWYGAGALTGTTATIGIANSATDYQTLNAPSAAPTSSSATFTTSIANSPANGQIYRWSSCSVTASATNDGPVCPGGTIHFTGVTSGTSYSWSGPGGFTSTSLSPTLVGISTGGSYVLSASNGTCTSTASTVVYGG